MEGRTLPNVEYKENFKRGLDKRAVESVGDFFEHPVGRDLRDDPDIQVFIRNNYIDFYLQGCRILSYKPNARTNQFRVNKAYLLGKSADKNCDVPLIMTNDDLVFEGNSYQQSVLSNRQGCVEDFVKGREDGRQGEKELLYKYWQSASDRVFLDVEIAFSSKVDGGKTHAKRLDLAWIALGSDTLVFGEAKVDDDSRLRAKDGNPAVAKAMYLYRDFLTNQTSFLQNSYRRICSNIITLGLCERFASRANISEANAWFKSLSENLVIDVNPVLVILESDRSPNDPNNRQQQLDGLLRKGNFPNILNVKRK